MSRSPALPAPSAEVHAEALARAQRLAAGLFPHQVEGVAFLLGRRRAILADDMGLGKTRQSITAIREAAPDGPWLVVCPASVKGNWAREIAAVRADDPIAIVGPASSTAAPAATAERSRVRWHRGRRCRRGLGWWRCERGFRRGRGGDVNYRYRAPIL